MFFFFLGGEKEDGDHDHLESLSRPVSGERTSSHDDNESVGSVRPGSAASGSITGMMGAVTTATCRGTSKYNYHWSIKIITDLDIVLSSSSRLTVFKQVGLSNFTPAVIVIKCACIRHIQKNN